MRSSTSERRRLPALAPKRTRRPRTEPGNERGAGTSKGQGPRTPERTRLRAQPGSPGPPAGSPRGGHAGRLGRIERKGGVLSRRGALLDAVSWRRTRATKACTKDSGSTCLSSVSGRTPAAAVPSFGTRASRPLASGPCAGRSARHRPRSPRYAAPPSCPWGQSARPSHGESPGIGFQHARAPPL